MNNDIKNTPLPNCRNCKHFFITYDQNTPNACKLFNIRSRMMPNQVIKKQSGEFCYGHEEKKIKHK